MRDDRRSVPARGGGHDGCAAPWQLLSDGLRRDS
jgi:hypothetical protein